MPTPKAPQGRTPTAAELRHELSLQQAQLQRTHAECAMALRRALELENALAEKAAEVSRQAEDMERLKFERDMAIVPAANVEESFDPGYAAEASDQQLLERSYLFDRRWYFEQYPDVARANLDAAWHYLQIGAEEGRNPSEFFDTQWYLQHYPEARQAECNPLVHYIRWGQAEGWRTRQGD